MPAPTKPQKSPDANVEKVVDLMRSRSVVGLAKYRVTTERTDLSPLEWVRHWQAENADATIYAEKLAQEIDALTATNARLKAQLAARNDELEVLHKALESARQSMRDLAVLWHEQFGVVSRQQIEALAADLGIELQWPKGWTRIGNDEVQVAAFKSAHDAKHAMLQSAADRARERVSGYSPSNRAELLKQGKASANSLAHDPSPQTPLDCQWNDAQTTPPNVGHAVIGMVNGTTKTRAVYYVAKTGKWVDVNDRPVTVSQWRHL